MVLLLLSPTAPSTTVTLEEISCVYIHILSVEHATLDVQGTCACEYKSSKHSVKDNLKSGSYPENEELAVSSEYH